jgi:hypothetical protein
MNVLQWCTRQEEKATRYWCKLGMDLKRYILSLKSHILKSIYHIYVCVYDSIYMKLKNSKPIVVMKYILLLWGRSRMINWKGVWEISVIVEQVFTLIWVPWANNKIGKAYQTLYFSFFILFYTNYNSNVTENNHKNVDI